MLVQDKFAIQNIDESFYKVGKMCIFLNLFSEHVCLVSEIQSCNISLVSGSWAKKFKQLNVPGH